MISFRERNPIAIGIASIIGITLGLVLAFYANRFPFIAQNYELKAEFADAAGLTPENEVRVAGIKVGKVTDVRLMKDRVLISMEIDDGIEIPRNSPAEISLKTILGTKFVAIDARGDADPYEDGDVIPLEDTSIPFEIYQASNAGVALLEDIDADQLNEGFKALANLTDDPNRNLARALDSGSQVAATLAGRSAELESLLRQGDELLATLDESSPEIQSLLENGDQVLDLLARRRATVQSLLINTDRLLASFGGLLRDNRAHIDSILRDLHAALVIVDRNLAELEEAVRILGPSSESFGRDVFRGRWATVCIMAMNAYIAGDTPVSAGTGAPGTPQGPVDCKGSG